MQHIFTSSDREPLSDSYLRATHWEDGDLYELSINFTGAYGQYPDRKLAKVMLTPEDASRLGTALLDCIEDRMRQEGLE